MKIKLIVFSIFTLNIVFSFAQNTTIQLKEKDKIEIKGLNDILFLDENIDYMTLTPIQMQSLEKSSYKILKVDTSFDNNLNSNVVTVNLVIFNIEFLNSSNLFINDVPAKVKFSIPDKKFENKNSFGLKLFKKVYNSYQVISSNNNNFPFEIILSDPIKLNSLSTIDTISPNISNPPTASNNRILQLNNINVVRIIPCDLSAATNIYKSDIVKFLSQYPNIQIEYELNIPPPAKAVSNLDAGVTIRFFENDTKQDSEKLQKELLKELKTNVISFDMQYLYSVPPRDNYIEIWIK